jgi:hypothetical protein
MQYFITGWGGLEPMKNRLVERIAGIFSGKSTISLKNRLISNGEKYDDSAGDDSKGPAGDDGVQESALRQETGEQEPPGPKKPGKEKGKAQGKKSKRGKRK